MDSIAWTLSVNVAYDLVSWRVVTLDFERFPVWARHPRESYLPLLLPESSPSRSFIFPVSLPSLWTAFFRLAVTLIRSPFLSMSALLGSWKFPFPQVTHGALCSRSPVYWCSQPGYPWEIGSISQRMNLLITLLEEDHASELVYVHEHDGLLTAPGGERGLWKSSGTLISW